MTAVASEGTPVRHHRLRAAVLGPPPRIGLNRPPALRVRRWRDPRPAGVGEATRHTT